MALKATIGYIPVVESINRKFALRREKINYGEASPKCYLGGMTRTIYRAGVGSISKNFLFLRKHAISVAPNADQLMIRQYFTLTTKSVSYIMKDISQITSVKNLWLQAKENPALLIKGVSAYHRSYRGWIWAVCWARYEAEETTQQVNTFPTAFDA